MPSSALVTRRTFIAGAAAFGMGLPSIALASKKNDKPALICFSKHLQFSRDYNELADMLADLGYDGTDLTVRKRGHVLPENVERDLPKAVEAVRKVGLDVQMITSDISDPDDEISLNVLKTASALGIGYYRIGSWRYDKNRPIPEQIDEYKPKLKKLAALNAQYKMRAGYHNHSGLNYIGGPLWDVYEMYKDVDPQWVGYNYDAAHAIAEGGARFVGNHVSLDKGPHFRSGGQGLRLGTERPQEMGAILSPRRPGNGRLALRAEKTEGTLISPAPSPCTSNIPSPAKAKRNTKTNCNASARDLNAFKQMLVDAGLR